MEVFQDKIGLFYSEPYEGEVVENMIDLTVAEVGYDLQNPCHAIRWGRHTAAVADTSRGKQLYIGPLASVRHALRLSGYCIVSACSLCGEIIGLEDDTWFAEGMDLCEDCCDKFFKDCEWCGDAFYPQKLTSNRREGFDGVTREQLECPSCQRYALMTEDERLALDVRQRASQISNPEEAAALAVKEYKISQ